MEIELSLLVGWKFVVLHDDDTVEVLEYFLFHVPR